MEKGKTMKIALNRLALIAMVFAAMVMLGTGLANAQSCSSSITSCGCTIGAPGNYTVDSGLFASQGLTLKNGCIDISGQDINLYAGDYNITGPGSDTSCDYPSKNKNAYTGVGIHVLPSAANVSIYFDADYSYVCGWNYGIESEGKNVDMFYPGIYYNNIGILFNNATGNDCLYCYTESNGTGIKIAGGSGNQINNSTASYNGQYGIWVAGSKQNIMNYNGEYDRDYGLYYNGIAGIYLGCSPTGNVKPSIPCSTPTTGNSVLSNYIYYNTKYGIAVEKGSIDNQFQENSAYDDKIDIIDGNGNCIYNQYLYNGFDKATPSCITDSW